MATGQFFTPRPVHRAWGQLATIKVPKPAVGKNWVMVAPPNFLTRVVAVRFPFVTSAQAAERVFAYRMTDGVGGNFAEVEDTAVIEAGQVSALTLATGLSVITGVKNQQDILALPEITLPSEFTIEGVTRGLQTEDQFGEGVALVEQFEPDPYHPLAEIAAEVTAILKLREAANYAAGN